MCVCVCGRFQDQLSVWGRVGASLCRDSCGGSGGSGGGARDGLGGARGGGRCGAADALGRGRNG